MSPRLRAAFYVSLSGHRGGQEADHDRAIDRMIVGHSSKRPQAPLRKQTPFEPQLWHCRVVPDQRNLHHFQIRVNRFDDAFAVIDMTPFKYSSRSFDPSTRQDFVKYLQIKPTGTSITVPECLEPMVKRGHLVVLGGPVWRRCLPDMREVLNVELLWYTNLVLVKRHTHEFPKERDNVRSSVHQHPPMAWLDTQRNGSQCTPQ